MEVLIQWWATVNDHEGILQFLGRDPAGNVSDGYFIADSAKQLTILLQDFILLTLFYNGSEEEGRKNFQKFYDLSE